MKPKGKLPFDPKMFLAKVGKGKTISKYRTDQIVFSRAGTRPAEWAWDSRSAVRSSKLTADDYRPQAMLGRVRRFNSPCRRRDKLRGDMPPPRIMGSNLSDLGR